MFIFSLFCLSFVLIGDVSGEKCKALSFERLCVTDGKDVTLENERLSLIINKAKGQITYLRFNSHVDPSIKKTNLVRGGSGYYLGNVEVNGNSAIVGPEVVDMKIIQDADHIDLAFIHKKGSKNWPTNFEFHLVLEKNSSMFYYYSLHKYLDDSINYSIGQLRWAIRAPENPFRHYNVDGKRAGTFPSLKEIQEAEVVQDTTWKLKDGSIYTKYQQISNNEDTNKVFGIFGDKIGMSLIQTRKEWVSGGPFKQDLTTHTGNMLLFHEHSGHYGTPGLVPKKGWTKVYGPVGFYVNDGQSPAEMYRDAQRQLKEEEAKWPYKWVTAPEYDANGRGTVSGHLKINGLDHKEWTYLTLTEPNVEDPQYESLTYMYSANTNKNGKFIIPAVRPGTYKLHIIARGVVGKYVQQNVHVTSKKNTDLGTINWQEESHGKELWRIGVPDRNAGEFRVPPGFPSVVPNLEEYRKFGTWLSYSKVFPNDIDFTVGRSDPAKDWCFFMPMIKTPGSPAHLEMVGVKQNTNPTNWKVRFEYNGSGKGKATLTLGVAADVKAGIRALVNGHEILKLASFEGPAADSALFRQAAHGLYRQHEVSFDASLLKKDNVLEFTPPGPVSANHYDKMIMWDFLRMEANE